MNKLLLVLILLFSQLSFAGELSGPFKVMTGDIPPYTMHYDAATGKYEGVVGEVVLAAIEKAGLKGKITTEWYPWKRAVEGSKVEKNVIIFPLTRLPEREASYKWVKLAITSNCHVFTLKPDVVISAAADLKKYKLGTLAGSAPQIGTAKFVGEGADKLQWDATSDEVINWKKLSADRLDAWITQDIVANYVVTENQKTEKDKEQRPLKKGLLIFTQPLWIAVNKDTSDADVKVLQEAFDNFYKTKEHAAILAKYGVAEQ